MWEGIANRSYFAKYFLFVLLNSFKNVGQCVYMGEMFQIRGTSFQSPMKLFLPSVSPVVYEIQVTGRAAFLTMKVLSPKRMQCMYPPHALYAIDVTFQQTNIPVVKHQKSKRYFIGQHKLYGYRVEFSENYIGRCTPLWEPMLLVRNTMRGRPEADAQMSYRRRCAYVA